MARWERRVPQGRDFPGMDEIEALSKLPLSEYRILLNKAFKQKNFSVDEDFNIIKGIRLLRMSLPCMWRRSRWTRSLRRGGRI